MTKSGSLSMLGKTSAGKRFIAISMIAMLLMTAVPLAFSSEAAAGVPLEPIGLKGMAGDERVSLNWTAPTSDGGSPLTNYAIYRGTAIGTEVLYVTVGNVTEYIDAGLENGVTYWYYVKAINTDGAGTASNEISATPISIPTMPTGLQAQSANGKIVLNWTAPLDIGGSSILNYTVYRAGDSWNFSKLVVLSDVLNYTDAGVVAGRTYYYQVSATNGAGEGAPSDAISTAIATTPSAVLDLEAIAWLSGVRLSWSAPDDNGGSAITGYVIYRGISNGDVSAYKVLGNVVTYVDLNVISGQRYWYFVKATNAIGRGVESEHVAVIPVSVSSAPTALSSSKNGSAVKLVWHAPSEKGGLEIIGYTIYRGTASGNETALVTVGDVLTYSDFSVVLGETYWYYVTALNEAGESVASNEVSIVPIAASSAPTDLAAVAGTDNITLTWVAPEDDGGSNITAYQIYRDDGTGAVLIDNVQGRLTYVDEDVTGGVSYLYFVKAYNNVGAGEASAPVVIAFGVAETGNDGDGGMDHTLLYIIGLLAVAVLVLLFLLLRQRRIGKKGETKDP